MQDKVGSRAGLRRGGVREGGGACWEGSWSLVQGCWLVSLGSGPGSFGKGPGSYGRVRVPVARMWAPGNRQTGSWFLVPVGTNAAPVERILAAAPGGGGMVGRRSNSAHGAARRILPEVCFAVGFCVHCGALVISVIAWQGIRGWGAEQGPGSPTRGARYHRRALSTDPMAR